MLVGIVRMILLKSKARIGRWKLAEVEDQIFGWDCRGGCMYKQGCENEGAITIL